MPRIVAIDYGQKRTGIAITDDFQIIASGLTTITSETVLSYLETYFNKEKVEKVIIGKPIQMNGQPSESAPIIDNFIKKFQTAFPNMPIEQVDERFTSKMASASMLASGLKKKQRQNKALIDEIAATIMLQSFLSSKKM
jgi:putative Holliday junction resolvase